MQVPYQKNYSTEFSENNRVIVSNLIDDEITLQETNEFKTEDNEYKEDDYNSDVKG